MTLMTLFSPRWRPPSRAVMVAVSVDTAWQSWQVPLPFHIASGVAEVVKGLDRKLYAALLATLDDIVEDEFEAVAMLVWPHVLAVRTQMALVKASSPMGEVLGRLIDAFLAAGANGKQFHPWASSPLGPFTTPAHYGKAIRGPISGVRGAFEPESSHGALPLRPGGRAPCEESA